MNKRFLLSLLLAGVHLPLTVMEKPELLADETSFFSLPNELRYKILEDLIKSDWSKAIITINNIASTNKELAQWINDPILVKWLIGKLSMKSFLDENIVASKLKLIGVKNPIIQQWLKKLTEEKELRAAVGRADIKKIKELIAKGVNVNAQDKYGVTALHYLDNAIRTYPNDISEIIQLFINAGASVNIKDRDGKTMMDNLKEMTRYAGSNLERVNYTVQEAAKKALKQLGQEEQKK